MRQVFYFTPQFPEDQLKEAIHVIPTGPMSLKKIDPYNTIPEANEKVYVTADAFPDDECQTCREGLCIQCIVLYDQYYGPLIFHATPFEYFQ